MTCDLLCYNINLMKKALRYILVIAGTIIFINLALVPLLEPGLLYFPARDTLSYPDQNKLQHQDVYLISKNGKKINGWFFKNSLSQKVILYLHGNADNISYPVTMTAVRNFYSLPANVFTIDYQGYGKSEGSPSENNVYQDAEAAYIFLREKKGFAPRNIIVAGNSMGGAAATYLAIHHEVGGLILQRTFTSIADMALRKNPLFRFPIIWLGDSFNNLQMIKQVAVPVLIAHSKQDEVIPFQMSLELYKNCPEPKKLFLVKTGGHDDDIFTPEYLRSLKKLLLDR